MVMAIAATYTVTHSVIGTTLVTATVGLKQGSPTSVILFIIFIEDLIDLNLEDESGGYGSLMTLDNRSDLIRYIILSLIIASVLQFIWKPPK